MSKESTIEEAEKIPWLWVIIPGIGFSFLGTMLASFLSSFPALFFTFQYTGFMMLFPPGPYLMLGLLLLLSFIPSVRARLNRKKLVYIYGATLIAVTYGGWYYPWIPLEGMALQPLLVGTYAKFVPSFFAPSVDIIKMSFLGGVAVPWGDWAPAIGFWCSWSIVWFFFMASCANIFRRLWIDIEQIPYPYATNAIELARTIHTADSTPDSRRVRLTLSFMVLGFIFFMPIVLRILLPKTVPDIYGWLGPPYISWVSGTIDMVAAFPALRSSIVGLIGFNWNPVFISLLYLAPLNTLLSFVLFYAIIVLIIPQLLYQMGFYTGILATTSASPRVMMLSSAPPLKLYTFFLAGVLPSLIIYNLILNWKYLTSTLRSKSSSSAEGSISDANEPLQYKWTYAMLIISSLLLLALMFAQGLGPASSIFLLIGVFLNSFGNSRMHGLAGPISGITAQHGYAYTRWLWPNMTKEQLNQEYVITNAWSASCLMANTSLGISLGPALHIMDFYRAASLEKVNNRNVFKAMSVVALIAPVVAFLTMISMMYNFGWMKLPVDKQYDFLANADPARVSAYPSPDPIWPWMLAGFILCGFISFMHTKYVWFFLDPVGLALAQPMTQTLVSVAFIAWVLKFITLKVGGAKFYEEKGIPAAVGFVAGYALCVLLGYLAGVIQFFFPF